MMTGIDHASGRDYSAVPTFTPVRGTSTAVQQDRKAECRKALAHRKAVKRHKAAQRRAGKR